MMRRRLSARLPTVATGLYCWAVAVLPLALAPRATPGVAVPTVLAPLALLMGLFLPNERWAESIAILGFLGNAGLVWLGWGGAGSDALPPPGSAEGPLWISSELGVIGLFAFALSWGALSSPLSGPGEGVGTPGTGLAPWLLVPRAEAVPLFVLPLLLPLLLLAPLRVENAAHSILATVLSLGLILSLGRTLSSLATARWVRGSGARPLPSLPSPRR